MDSGKERSVPRTLSRPSSWSSLPEPDFLGSDFSTNIAGSSIPHGFGSPYGYASTPPSSATPSSMSPASMSPIPTAYDASSSSLNLPWTAQGGLYSLSNDQLMGSPALHANESSPYFAGSPASDSMLYMGSYENHDISPFGSEISLASQVSVQSAASGSYGRANKLFDSLYSLFTPRKKFSSKWDSADGASDNDGLETASARKHRISLFSSKRTTQSRPSISSGGAADVPLEATTNGCFNCKAAQSPSWHWTPGGKLCAACGLLDQIFHVGL
ncbi:hypothetical protein PUNSTDRAFT_131712 [Punctularia strigosozonata HHB-11173 SS5]|uniref:uncharacterized protein n=1 Tax=Punctularia strigosozonata (strain HHB-11173) TaxID=741275 RepID=UPI00044182D4|nr:uncharacterized protein PUNSTDRAFT_131712 [Punctularia strigosozonata HHB-11173 SS5]EIN11549.1 hypothetical protein PUNSTDRAFT_131712 [Punctularia strigosozonata HHB-11173 SS5]